MTSCGLNYWIIVDEQSSGELRPCPVDDFLGIDRIDVGQHTLGQEEGREAVRDRTGEEGRGQGRRGEDRGGGERTGEEG